MQALLMEDLARELVADHARRAEARKVRKAEGGARRSWRRSLGLGLIGLGFRIAGRFQPGLPSQPTTRERLGPVGQAPK
jgi:hypothetical protein